MDGFAIFCTAIAATGLIGSVVYCAFINAMLAVYASPRPVYRPTYPEIARRARRIGSLN